MDTYERQATEALISETFNGARNKVEDRFLTDLSEDRYLYELSAMVQYCFDKTGLTDAGELDTHVPRELLEAIGLRVYKQILSQRMGVDPSRVAEKVANYIDDMRSAA